MEIPTSVVASELWLRDDLEGVYALLFRSLDRLPAGALQRGLGRDAEVRHSGARSHRLRSETSAARPRRALATSVNTLLSCLLFVLVLHSHHKSIGGRSSSATSSRRRARRAQSTATCHGLRVMEPVCHQASLRGRFRSWMRASRQGQPCSCLFSRHIRLASFVLFCAEPQTSREVDQDPEGGLTTQCNGGLCVRLYSFWFSFAVAGGAGGAGEALRAGASLVTVDVLTGHICSVSLSLYVPTERDKYVWLVQSRRRPEKWTRTRKACSRGSATPDPVS